MWLQLKGERVSRQNPRQNNLKPVPMKNIRNAVMGICAIVIILLLIQKCSSDNQRQDLMNQLAMAKHNEHTFQTIRRQDSSTIVQQTQIILTQDEAIKAGLVTLDGSIKRLQSQIKVGSTIYIDSVDVPFIPQNFADTTGLWSKYRQTPSGRVKDSVAVPQSFAVSQKWFSIGGEVRKQGLHIDSIVIPNKTEVSVGLERKNFFSKLSPVIEVKNDNPYLQVKALNNVVVKQKNPILHSKIFWFGVGLVSAVLLK